MTPFLKWPGGKRWLTKKLPSAFSRAISAQCYIEPFLGGAAAFFHIKPKNAVLSDLNVDLISTYRAVRDHPRELVDRLKKHAVDHSPDYYYSTRANKPQNAIELAAWLVYLNRTCFNGIYRVNKRGQFNVPKGTKTSVLLNTDDFDSISDALKCADLRAADFEETLQRAGQGDFIFADPPYTVKHNLNGFIKYNEQIFSWKDQERLADALYQAASRGATVLVSNANHVSIQELYRGSFISVVQRQTVIGADDFSRGSTSELLIALGDWTAEELMETRTGLVPSLSERVEL